VAIHILDLSKVEAGQLTLDRADFDLAEVVESTAEVLALRAHSKGLELLTHVLPEVPTNLIGDAGRLRQVLTNLLGNAIKFTEQGEVGLRIEGDPEAGEPGTLRFSVWDTGIGIPPEKLETIFEAFTQVDVSTTRKYGGTGLGLAISKRLVELMGGCIWAESQPGRGSTFSFTTRFEIQSETRRDLAAPPVDLAGWNVLVVDDNATNRLILRQLLAPRGARVTEVGSGALALAELTRARETADLFKLVLLDSRMPGMDGFEVAEHLRKDRSTLDTTIIMLTSDQRSGDLDRARQLGLSAYLVKPIRLSELLKTIAASVGQRGSSVKTALASRAIQTDHRPLRILLVEDSQDNRALIHHYVKHHPYQLDLAENGEIGVRKLQAGGYDLVLMDMQMPVMDGYAATRAIRAWEHQQGRQPTPIIALTANALAEDAQKSLDAGCSAHIAKPVKKPTLLEAIASHAREPQPIKRDGAAPPNGKTVVRVDPDLGELVPEFLDHRLRDVTAISEALERGDYEAIRIRAHSMKGSGGGYGFDAITEIGARLERAAKRRRPEEIRDLAGELATYLGHVEVIYA
jgi:CheY-like chemotaxis protein/anti-sigma regulatory factor (Ser/Thr protein kinase)